MSGIPVERILENALDAAARRHGAIAQNLANVDTPGFKRREVVFSQKLRESLEAVAAPGRIRLLRTHPLHLDVAVERPEEVSAREVKEAGLSQRADGNNVDVDREMVELLRNAIQYNALVSVISRRLAFLRLSATEGRR